MDKIVDEKQYKERIIDKKIDEYLSVFGAVSIEGPKWSGKSWTSSHHASSEFLVGDPANNFSNRALAEAEPSLVLEGKTPRLIDEWQEVPSLWDATRAYVDRKSSKGQIILTGSSTPKHKGIMHSGTGRIGKIKMNTMSLYESGDSTGQVSISKLASGEFHPFLFEQVGIEKIAYLICRGGWPGNISVKVESASLLAQSYIQSLINEDIVKLGRDEGVNYRPEITKRLLKSLARNEATVASNNKLMSDIAEYDKETMSKNTLVRYLDAIERLFIIKNIEPYSPNLRSSLRVKQMEKRHFCDCSLVAALLNLSPKKLLSDLNTMGFLFESMVEHDLGIYADALGGKLYHYQDYAGNEIDAVIELEDGNWCAFEIKLGLYAAEKGADNLAKVVKNIEKQPLFKCVIYGAGNACYKRQDGTYIVPITALKN